MADTRCDPTPARSQVNAKSKFLVQSSRTVQRNQTITNELAGNSILRQAQRNIHGAVSGLRYGLSIGTTAGGAAILPTTSFSGNGYVLPYFINGTMPANQAGSCASATCTLSDPRTLTFTF